MALLSEDYLIKLAILPPTATQHLKNKLPELVRSYSGELFMVSRVCCWEGENCEHEDALLMQ